ncbi:MAG: DUF2520 domain-containing protein [Bryobacteraceae bacterium]|nr:DUF2520 domain-containing protein [Bryobacteraceae bacterium]MDW8376606.1 DUF2520 domain-containing protein [Bryobacterales bacterium]
MKTFQPVALLAAGKIRDSFLRNLPSIQQSLGPVRSSSLRLASRICGILGGGYPVDSYEDFDTCELILISVPEPWLTTVVEELLETSICWKNKTVVLCDEDLESDVLGKLAHLGARTASIALADRPESKLLIAEGDRRALRVVKLFTERSGFRLLTIDSGRKRHYRAGTAFATTLAMPLITACVETLRASGLEQNVATMIAGKLLARSMRSYSQAGRRSWEGPLVGRNLEVVRKHVLALFQLNPLLASYYYENSVLAVQLLRQDPQWLTKLAPEVYPRAAGD